MKTWSGRAVMAERDYWAQFLPCTCWRCGQIITEDHEWHVGHVEGRDESPELTWDRLNHAPEHARCSTRAGARYRNRKHGRPRRHPAAATQAGAVLLEEKEPEPPESIDVTWEDVKDWGVAPPLYFSAPHPTAVGTRVDYYYKSCQKLGISPLPWQEIVATRALEYNDQGDWCWPFVVISASRQSGKSVGLLRPWAVARVDMGLDWGVTQFITHVARVRQAATKLVRRPDAIKLAESLGLDRPRLTNGEESWVWPEGSIWQVFSTGGAYGESSGLVLGDECWDITSDDFWEGLHPTTTEAFRPQIVLVSAAHKDATDLMLERVETAISNDPTVMIALWGAAPGDDPYDVRTWWKSSPRWSKGRFDAMLASYKQKSFPQQYLNIWPKRKAGGEDPGQLAAWASAPKIDTAPPPGLVGAIEMDGEGTSYGAAVVEWLPDGSVHVWSVTTRTLPEAEAVLTTWQVSYVLAGASFTKRLTIPAEGATSAMIREALPELRRLLKEGKVTHNHHTDSVEQFKRAKVVTTDTGPTISTRQSGGPVAAVKAVIWGVKAARELAENAPQIWT